VRSSLPASLPILMLVRAIPTPLKKLKKESGEVVSSNFTCIFSKPNNLLRSVARETAKFACQFQPETG